MESVDDRQEVEMRTAAGWLEMLAGRVRALEKQGLAGRHVSATVSLSLHPPIVLFASSHNSDRYGHSSSRLLQFNAVSYANGEAPSCCSPPLAGSAVKHASRRHRTLTTVREKEKKANGRT